MASIRPLLLNDSSNNDNGNVRNNNTEHRNTLHSYALSSPLFYPYYEQLLPLRRLMRTLALHSRNNVSTTERIYAIIILFILLFPWVNYVADFGHAKNTVQNVIVFATAHILFLISFALGRSYCHDDHLSKTITTVFIFEKDEVFPSAPSSGENLTVFRRIARRVVVQFTWIVALTVLCYLWFIVAFSGQQHHSNEAGIIFIDIVALLCTAVCVAQFAFICLVLKMVLHMHLMDIRRHLALYEVPRLTWYYEKGIDNMNENQLMFIHDHLSIIGKDYLRLCNSVSRTSHRFRFFLLICFCFSFVGGILSCYEMLNTIHDHKHSGKLSTFENIVVYVPNFLTFFLTMAVLGVCANIAHKSKHILRKASEYHFLYESLHQKKNTDHQSIASSLVSLITSRPIYFSLYGIIIDRTTGFTFLSPLVALLLFLIQRALSA